MAVGTVCHRRTVAATDSPFTANPDQPASDKAGPGITFQSQARLSPGPRSPTHTPLRPDQPASGKPGPGITFQSQACLTQGPLALRSPTPSGSARLRQAGPITFQSQVRVSQGPLALRSPTPHSVQISPPRASRARASPSRARSVRPKARWHSGAPPRALSRSARLSQAGPGHHLPERSPARHLRPSAAGAEVARLLMTVQESPALLPGT